MAGESDGAAHLPIGVFVVSSDGALRYANRTLTDWVGQPDVRRSARTFPWRAQVNLADRARVDSAWADGLDGAELRATFTWTLDRAATMPAPTAVVQARWVDDADGRRLVGMLEPASDTERSTGDWSTYAAMLDHSPDATLVVGTDGCIASANPAAAILLGCDEDHLDGANIADLIHPDDLGLVAEAFADTVVGGPRIGFVVIRVRHRDGDWVHVEAAGSRMVDGGRPGGLVVTCRDVTARYQHDDTRERVRSRFEKAFDRAPIGMALIGLDGRLVRVNEVLTQMVGRSANELTGRSMFELAHPQDRDLAIAHAFSVLESGIADPVELRFVRPDGNDAWARISSSVIHDDAGDLALGLVHAEDITEQRQLREQLHRAATCDPLTGLLNRAGLAACFDADRVDGPDSADGADTADGADGAGLRALMIIDLDGFKAVNDRHGHLVGDDVLCAVASRLQRCLRVDCVIARIGGDEFAIYVPHVQDAATAEAIGERVRESLAEPHRVGAHTVRVPGSVGVALLDGAVGPSDALAAADLASYEAKRAGGNAARLARATGTGGHEPAGAAGARSGAGSAGD